jgi:SAM-dependent methyltransferase
VVNPDAIYKRYTYLTSVSKGLVEHFERYAETLCQRYHPKPGSLVVELGSNEGAMLRSFRARGLRVLGIDPAKDIACCATSDGIETWPVYFSEKIARDIWASGRGEAQIIIANNVLANIDDLDDVARGIKELLTPSGVFVFETSYLLDVVERALIDTIFHEHISYFAVKPLRQFFAGHGLELIDAERTSPKGGSLRCTVQRQGGPWPVSPSVSELIELEEYVGIDREAIYACLGQRLETLKEKLLTVVLRAERHNKVVAAWGAADGPNTMIHYFGLGPRLRFILDDNPQKISLFSPGWHLPVLSAKALEMQKPDVVILLAWRYADMIMRAHPGYLQRGGQWVIPLPEVKVIP